jgi:16S rRNA pseudouridine516 synthase
MVTAPCSNVQRIFSEQQHLSARRSRLDRLLAKRLGISPDDVRPLLASKRIKVNGRFAEAREQLVDGFSVISVDDVIVQSQPARYVMLHKPCGVLSATRDPRHPVAPASGVSKQYDVTLRDPLHEGYIAAFAAGMHFPYEDITTRPALLEILGECSARVTLQEGRYHQLKRMFGRFRNPVLAIHRRVIGGLQLDPALQPGEWRELTREEVAAATYSCGEPDVRRCISSISS